jgi:hypothetical protein
MATRNSGRRWLAGIAVGAVLGALAVGVTTRVSDDRAEAQLEIATGPALGALPTSSETEPRAAQESEATPKDEAGFWRLMDEARSAGDGETDDVSSRLQERLSQMSPQAIVEFARIRHRLDERAYTWDVWGAAYVIEDGCSEDCFRDFRSYLISLGRGPYEAALRDPDSLAGVVQDAETGDWENADNVAPDAYASVTGEDFPLDDSDLSGSPRGASWDSENEGALIARYPKLAARFR